MKGEVIERALTIIQMFAAGPVTCRMIQDRFDISRPAAHRWITQASRFLPIIENGFDTETGGRPGIKYGLMKNEMS